jgi:hypothetical protein
VLRESVISTALAMNAAGITVTIGQRQRPLRPGFDGYLITPTGCYHRTAPSGVVADSAANIGNSTSVIGMALSSDLYAARRF